jgi:hypothetical protein
VKESVGSQACVTRHCLVLTDLGRLVEVCGGLQAAEEAPVAQLRHAEATVDLAHHGLQDTTIQRSIRT